VYVMGILFLLVSFRINVCIHDGLGVSRPYLLGCLAVLSLSHFHGLSASIFHLKASSIFDTPPSTSNAINNNTSHSLACYCSHSPLFSSLIVSLLGVILLCSPGGLYLASSIYLRIVYPSNFA
jgi:hypothetical protein